MVPPRTRRRRTGWIRTAVGLIVLAAVVQYVVLPRMAGSGQALELLRRLQPGWVALGIGCEAASLVSYSLITRRVIKEYPPTFSWLLRTDLTGYGVGRVVPGGGATATALRYRLLVSGGARPESVTAAIAAQGIGCTVALAAIFWFTLIPAIVGYGPRTPYLVAWLTGALVVACTAFAAYERSRLAGPARRALHVALRVLPQRWQPRVGDVAQELGHLLTDRDTRRAFALWAVLNWLLDAAALWVFLTAFGEPTNPVTLLLAYSIASLLAVLPITPGGLGVIEGVLIPALIGFGVPAAVAALGVVAWRLFQYWLPVPLAGLCYLSLRTPGWRHRVAATSHRRAAHVSRSRRDLRPYASSVSRHVLEGRHPEAAARGKVMNVHQTQSRVITERATAVRRATLAPEELPDWFAESYAAVAAYLHAQGTRPDGSPFARYHMRPDGRFDVEAGFPVASAITGDATVRPSVLPGGAVVTLWHVGPYDQVGQTYATIADWIRSVDAIPAGDAWEIYHDPPDTDPAKLRTEVVQPYTYPRRRGVLS